MSNGSSGLYTFGSYRLNAAARVLTRSGAVVAVAPKTFDLLVFMAESGGRLLSKRELMEALWKGTFVEEANLSFQMSSLRKALGQEGDSWIEAVPKHGYRFKAPVERIGGARELATAGCWPGSAAGTRSCAEKPLACLVDRCCRCGTCRCLCRRGLAALA